MPQLSQSSSLLMLVVLLLLLGTVRGDARVSVGGGHRVSGNLEGAAAGLQAQRAGAHAQVGCDVMIVYAMLLLLLLLILYAWVGRRKKKGVSPSSSSSRSCTRTMSGQTQPNPARHGRRVRM